MCKNYCMESTERFEAAVPRLSEGEARQEAELLQTKMSAGEAATPEEANLILEREENRRKLEQKTEEINRSRTLLEKILFRGKVDADDVLFNEAKKSDQEIAGLVRSGKAQSATEAVSQINEQHEKKVLVSSPKERDLLERLFARRKKLLGGAIGDAQLVALEGDGNAVFKPHSGYDGDLKKHYIHRERAAYLVDRFLGFNFVPPTVIREIGDKVGSLQEYIPSAKVGGSVRKGDIPEEELAKLRLFDMLVRNTDRHGGNYLFKNKKVHAIDHGLSFVNLKRGSGGYDYLGSRIPADLQKSFARFSEWPEGKELLADALGDLLNEGEVKQFMQRLESFLAAVDSDGYFSRNAFENGLTPQSA